MACISAVFARRGQLSSMAVCCVSETSSQHSAPTPLLSASSCSTSAAERKSGCSHTRGDVHRSPWSSAGSRRRYARAVQTTAKVTAAPSQLVSGRWVCPCPFGRRVRSLRAIRASALAARRGGWPQKQDSQRPGSAAQSFGVACCGRAPPRRRARSARKSDRDNAL
eukprot:scaffold107842_cov69-Phaeocystis_antarctica.AAC.4